MGGCPCWAAPSRLAARACNPILLAHNVHRVAHSTSLHSHRWTDNHSGINHLARFRRLAPRVQFPRCLRVRGEDRGCHLTTLFGTTTVPIVAAINAPTAPKKHGWLPLLVVLFLISYGLMTMLIVEQGRTIESQRALIVTAPNCRRRGRLRRRLPRQTRPRPRPRFRQPPSTSRPRFRRPRFLRLSTRHPRPRQPRHKPVRPRLPRQDRNRPDRNIARRVSPPRRNRSSECRPNQPQIWWTMSGPKSRSKDYEPAPW
jgi:hypothetical protein